MGSPEAAPPAPLCSPRVLWSCLAAPAQAEDKGPSSLKHVGTVPSSALGAQGHPISRSHSLRGLDQWHSTQPQHQRPPEVADFLDGGDLQQVESFNQVKTCRSEHRM